MNTQDNGPRDGDFVRYIDELTARVAAKQAAAATTAIAEVVPATRPRSVQSPAVVRATAPHLPSTIKATQAMQPASAAPSIGALFNIALFVIGGLLFAIGFLATDLGALVVIGAGLLAWGVRRTKGSTGMKA